MAASGYRFQIENRPDFAFLTVAIPTGRTLCVEASAMATMSPHLRMKTRLKGGLARLVTGESLFLNEFTAEGAEGEIGIAPGAPGDLEHLALEGQAIFLQNSAFLAAAPEVRVATQWQGLVKGFFSGSALFLIRCEGTGDLWFSAYGALVPIDVDGEYVVDTGHVIGFTGGLEYSVARVGGYRSLFFSGEGLVCRFTGKGRVWVQTRDPVSFAHWAHPFRPGPTRGLTTGGG